MTTNLEQETTDRLLREKLRNNLDFTLSEALSMTKRERFRHLEIGQAFAVILETQRVFGKRLGKEFLRSIPRISRDTIDVAEQRIQTLSADGLLNGTPHQLLVRVPELVLIDDAEFDARIDALKRLLPKAADRHLLVNTYPAVLLLPSSHLDENVGTRWEDDPHRFWQALYRDAPNRTATEPPVTPAPVERPAPHNSHVLAQLMDTIEHDGAAAGEARTMAYAFLNAFGAEYGMDAYRALRDADWKVGQITTLVRRGLTHAWHHSRDNLLRLIENEKRLVANGLPPHESRLLVLRFGSFATSQLPGLPEVIRGFLQNGFTPTKFCDLAMRRFEIFEINPANIGPWLAWLKATGKHDTRYLAPLIRGIIPEPSTWMESAHPPIPRKVRVEPKLEESAPHVFNTMNALKLLWEGMHGPRKPDGLARFQKEHEDLAQPDRAAVLQYFVRWLHPQGIEHVVKSKRRRRLLWRVLTSTETFPPIRPPPKDDPTRLRLRSILEPKAVTSARLKQPPPEMVLAFRLVCLTVLEARVSTHPWYLLIPFERFISDPGILRRRTYQIEPHGKPGRAPYIYMLVAESEQRFQKRLAAHLGRHG